MRAQPTVAYPLIGMILGAGAPVGSFLIRVLAISSVRNDPLGDLGANAFFYAYELLGSSLVLAVAGYFAGLRADRLRRGEAFYHHLAEHDSLTGLHNMRAFMDRYRRALEHAVATGEPLAVLLIDVDKLKEINDALGHEAGNKALIQVANALRISKRTVDVAARWGGDEFAILLESAGVSAAMRVARAIEANLRDSSSHVSVTIGICATTQPSLSADLFEGADRALLAGKNHGRNTIEALSI